MEQFLPIFNAIYPNREPLYTRHKPMQVLALGLSRSGTESLSKALTHLGYEDVYHGLQLVEYRIGEIPQWYRLTRAKQIGNSEFLNQEEFDKVLGRSMAVTDVPCCAFGPELVRIYPDAKIILNQRRDAIAWEKSIRATLIGKGSSLFSRMLLCFEHDLFWTGLLRIRIFEPLMVQPLLEYPEGMVKAYEVHYEQLRRECARQGRQYLDWDPGDGWEPLCEFLRQPVPDVPFPQGNTPADMAKFGATVQLPRIKRAKTNMAIFAVTVLGALVSGLLYTFR